jgi:hypothetical protein
LGSIPVSRTTGYRWRKAGIIETLVIAGRRYVTEDAIAEFTRRAKEGEYSNLSTSFFGQQTGSTKASPAPEKGGGK